MGSPPPTSPNKASRSVDGGDSNREPWWETQDQDRPVIFYRKRRKGIGDIVTILPACQILRKLAPQLRIVFQTHFGFHPLLRGHPAIDEVISLHDPTPDGRVIDLTSVCAAYESERLSRSVAVDKPRNRIFAEACGLPYQGEAPRLPIAAESVAAALVRYPSLTDGGPKVGVVLKSAERWKDYPWNAGLAALLLSKGCDVFTVDRRETLPDDRVHAVTDLSLTDLMGFLVHLDVLVTPDTGPLHLAEALDVPAVAIFGSLSGELRRTAYRGSTTRALQKSNCGRQPCFYSRCKGVNQYQPCMTQVHPTDVWRQVQATIGRSHR